jgi:hypothetical protein
MAEEPTVESLTAALETANAALADFKAKHQGATKDAKENRLRAEKLETDLAGAQSALAAAQTAAEQKVAEAEKAKADAIASAEATKTEAVTKAQERVINADLKIAAKEAGAHDVADILALLDRSKLKLNDDKEVTNAAELMAELKKAKPHLFGAASSSSTSKTPPPKDPVGKAAKDMSEEEFEAAFRAKAWRK